MTRGVHDVVAELLAHRAGATARRIPARHFFEHEQIDITQRAVTRDRLRDLGPGLHVDVERGHLELMRQLADRGRADRARADRGRADRRRADRGCAGCGRRIRAQHRNQCAPCGCGHRGAADRGVRVGYRSWRPPLHVLPRGPRPALAFAPFLPEGRRFLPQSSNPHVEIGAYRRRKWVSARKAARSAGSTSTARSGCRSGWDTSRRSS